MTLPDANAGDLRKILATASYRNVALAKAGVKEPQEINWVPAFAGTTDNDVYVANKVTFHPYGAFIALDAPEKSYY